MHMHCHTQFLTETTKIHCLTVQTSLAYSLEDINVIINQLLCDYRNNREISGLHVRYKQHNFLHHTCELP